MIPIGKYINAKTKVLCECVFCHREVYLLPHDIYRGHGCRKCAWKQNGHNLTKTTDIFIEEMHLINPEDIVVGEYVGSHTKIAMKCGKCGDIYKAVPTHLLQGKGCPRCKGTKIADVLRKSHEQFCDELKRIQPDITVTGVYHGAAKRVDVQCKNGHHWSPVADSLLRGYGCPQCEKSRSRGERIVEAYLDMNYIPYQYRATFDGLVGVGGLPLSYDYHITGTNILIEIQGVQHERPVEHFGGEFTFGIQTEHDRRKREYAQSHNYQLVEIWYYDLPNVESYLESILNPVTITA